MTPDSPALGVPIVTCPTWCSDCDTDSSAPADPVERARTIALVQHTSGASLGAVQLVREDRIIVTPDGDLALAVGETMILLPEGDNPMSGYHYSPAQAATLAESLPAALALAASES